MPGPDLEGYRLGGFELREQLGAGAFASVWRARQLRLGRDVAVKVLDPVLARNPDAARRFEREGRSAASLDHPTIVPVYEAGEDQGLVYLAMRLIEGETLDDLLDREGPLSVQRTTELLEPISQALDHAHSRDLTHRDIKPSNILLDEERVWLADFGIAATTQEIGRYTVGSIGTAEYMAPEQANQGDTDHRADLYSFGCVAFHCLTGGPPYAGDDLLPVMLAHVNDPIPSSGHPSYDAFFSAALAKDANDRFQSGHDFIAAFAQLDGQLDEVLAGPMEGPAKRISRPRNPRRLAVLLVATVLVAVIGLLITRGNGEEPTASESAIEEVTGQEDLAASATEVPAPTTTETEETQPTASAEQEPPSELASGGLAIIGSNLPLASLNPHTDFNTTPFLTYNVLPSLVRVTDDFSIEPNLAARMPEVVETDPLTILWTLRDDAIWDDDTPITSRDVEATYEYLTSGTTNLLGTYFYDQIDTFTVIDDTQFTVSFAEPIGAWRLLFSTTHPVIKAAAYTAHIDSGEPLSEFLQTELTFSGGPYRIVGFESGDRVSLRRNDLWWGEPARLERVTFRHYETTNDQIAALGSGDVDFIYIRLPAAAEVTQAATLNNIEVDTGASDNQFEMAFNLLAEPFDDIAMRQAFAHAVDRTALTAVLVQPVTGKQAEPLESLVHYPRQPQYTTPFAVYGDVATAERMLDEAGWKLGVGDVFRSKDGVPLSVTIMFRSTSVDIINAEGQAQFVRDRLRAVGIDAQLEGLGRTDYTSRRSTGDWQIRLDFTGTNIDPAGVLLRFGSDFCPPSVEGCDGDPIGFNFGAYSNPQVDALIDETKITESEERRRELFQQIDQLLANDVPTLPLYEGPAFMAHVSDLTGATIESPRGGPLAHFGDWAYLASLE